MDRITKSILETFAQENGLTNIPEETQFEHLTAYLTMRRHFSRALNTEDVVIGKGGDTGLDAIAIILNGTLITDVDQVQEMVDQNGYLEATFIFVQAERSAGFDGAKIGTIGHGIEDFFSDDPKMVRNDAVKECAAIMTAIYDKSPDFRKGVACQIYYVTTGSWASDQNLSARRDAVVASLRASEIFEEVDFRCFGAEDIHRMYQASKNAISRTFLFEKKVEIPAVPGVELAYLGMISAVEFVKLISDDAGDAILDSIFYDNVRDWQDYNDVNSAMRKTIESNEQLHFVLMNNGITIIVKTLTHVGSVFTIKDFQIVNGCQTSNVIFDQRSKIKSDMMVPLRLIYTNDENVTESIVFATNRQTELKEEQLYARTEFSKSLENFFSSITGQNRLYYERRDGQYDRLPAAKGRIVTPQIAIKAFASMFLDEPHTATKNYKAIRALVGTDIFKKGHAFEPYYVAALAAAKLDSQFRQKIGNHYKSARYHILLILRLLLDSGPVPHFNSREIVTRCNAMISAFDDSANVDVLFQKAADTILDISGGDLSRDNIRTSEMTDKILARFRKQSSSEAAQ